ncbi:19414_t:CDS:1, partial [Gigaspora rosea]
GINKSLDILNLSVPLQQMLPPAYKYQIKSYNELDSKITYENVYSKV